MAYRTWTGGATRTVEAKGDIADVITMLKVDDHPILALIGEKHTQDINPKTPEDTLSAISATNFYATDANAPAAADTARTLNQNVVQRMLKTASVTTQQNAVAQYGMGKELKYQEAKKVIELMRDAEATLISDQVLQHATFANGYIGKMSGMSGLMTTTTRAKGAAYVDITLAYFNTDMTTVVAAGGSPSICFLDATAKGKVNAWTTTPTRYHRPGEYKKLDPTVLIVQGVVGPEVEFRHHPHMPQVLVATGSVMMVIDPALWKRRDLIPLHKRSLPDNGAGPSTLWEWQWTIDCLAEQGNFTYY